MVAIPYYILPAPSHSSLVMSTSIYVHPFPHFPLPLHESHLMDLISLHPHPKISVFYVKNWVHINWFHSHMQDFIEAPHSGIEFSGLEVFIK